MTCMRVCVYQCVRECECECVCVWVGVAVWVCRVCVRACRAYMSVWVSVEVVRVRLLGVCVDNALVPAKVLGVVVEALLPVHRGREPEHLGKVDLWGSVRVCVGGERVCE